MAVQPPSACSSLPLFIGTNQTQDDEFQDASGKAGHALIGGETIIMARVFDGLVQLTVLPAS